MWRLRLALIYMAAVASTRHAARPEHLDDFDDDSFQVFPSSHDEDSTNIGAFEASEFARRQSLLSSKQDAERQPQSSHDAASSAAVAEHRQSLEADSTNDDSADDNVALCTMANNFGPDIQRLLQSIEFFYPKAQIYVAATSSMEADLKQAFPTLKLDVRPSMDKYIGLNRDDMMRKHLWLQLNMEKVEIMRAALSGGHAGAWYIDADAYLLAALPATGANSLYLTPHRSNQRIKSNFGIYNSGCVFARSTAVLDEWKRVSPEAHSACCQDQTALDVLATKFNAGNMSCGVNVGWYQMNKQYNPEGQDLYDKLSCKDGVVFFKDCPVVSMHYHTNQYENTKLAEHLQTALAECHHPMMEFAKV